jgi:putative transposase
LGAPFSTKRWPLWLGCTAIQRKALRLLSLCDELNKTGAAVPNYRRIKIAGGCFFFTVCLADRRASTLTDYIEDLKAAWRWTKSHKPFSSPAWVVLPDHIHCIWKLPPGDDDYAVRWKLLKGHFTRAMVARGKAKTGRRSRERGVWQRRFWEHAIRDERDLENHMIYIRGNPVRHGLVKDLEDWQHSSFYQNFSQNDAMS